MSKEQAIQEALQRIDGVSKFLGRGEVKELPNILWEDELPERIIQGTYNNGNGILVATNKRLLFIDKGMLWGLKVEDFPYDKISSIEYGTGMILGKLTIYASGNKAVIENVAKDQVRQFADYVRARSTKATAHASAPAPQPAPVAAGEDPLAKLERLNKLRQDGAIDEAEYKELKRKLIGGL